MALPFVSEKKGRLFVGDAAVRDGTKPISSIYDWLDPDNLMIWTGSAWKSHAEIEAKRKRLQK